MVQQALDQLAKEGLQLHGQAYVVKLCLFGDMAFLHSVLGGSGCSSDRPCILCNIHSRYLMWKKDTFLDEGVEFPATITLKMRTMLSHAFGEEYGLPESY